jgi:hydrogenase maturation protease
MIRIIGIGSPFGDDQVGWRVIERLDGRLPPHVALSTLDRPGSALIRWLQDVDWLILVDALSCRGAPGQILRIDPAQIEAGVSALSSHGLDLAQTLDLAAALGCRPRRVDVYGIVIEQITGPGPGPAVAAAVPELARLLEQSLQQGPTAVAGPHGA